MAATPAQPSAELLAELEEKYFWWEPVGSAARTDERVIAQAMELGSFADIRRLEETLGPRRLAAVMAAAQPGWIGARSWEFWRGRLSAATGQPIAEEPPRRSFHDAAL